MTKKEKNAIAATMGPVQSLDCMIARYEDIKASILSQQKQVLLHSAEGNGLRHSMSWVIMILADLKELRARAIER